MHTLRWRTAAPGTCAPPELLPKKHTDSISKE